MDGGSTCEIETAEDKGPSVGVPRPICDGVVDESGPNEDEDDHGTQTTAFGDGTDGEHGGDCGEHELVYAEYDGGDTCGTHGRSVEDTDEGSVFEITDEFVTSF